jgi:hypothetical protein
VTEISGPAARQYLLVKGLSGLGNRLLSALAGILYARVAGRRLVIDWNDPVYSDDGSDVFHRFFVCPSAGRIDEIPETDSVVPGIWRGHLRDPASVVQREYNRLAGARLYARLARLRLVRGSSKRGRSRRHISIEMAHVGYEAEVAVLAGWPVRIDWLRPYLHGELAELGRMSTAAIHRTLLREEIVLHPEIQARVDEFRAAHFDAPMVGMHLRLSDRRVRVQAILDAADALLSRRPDLRVFAATDSIEGKELLERRYRGVVMTPHWYPPAGTSQHNNPACPARSENGIEALVDLYLHAGCDYLVADGTSSFARLAALLRSAPEGHAIDLRPGPSRLTVLQRRLWLRYAASDSVVAGIVRTGARVKHPIVNFQLRPRSGRRLLTGPRRSPER